MRGLLDTTPSRRKLNSRQRKNLRKRETEATFQRLLDIQPQYALPEKDMNGLLSPDGDKQRDEPPRQL